jgi:hypothetical protein
MTASLNYEKIAREVRSHLETAVGEVASDMLSPGSGFLDDKWKKRINKAKKNGCRDIMGWLADELFNDPDTISDFMGDRIYEATNGNDADYNKVLDVLSTNAFPGMKKACDSLRRKS